MSHTTAIRKQLRDQPNRKTFRKSRHVLLDLVVELEILRKVVRDQELEIKRMRNDSRNEEAEYRSEDRIENEALDGDAS